MQGHIHKRVRTCKNGRKSTLAVRARLIHELTTGFYVEPSRMLLSE